MRRHLSQVWSESPLTEKIPKTDGWSTEKFISESEDEPIAAPDKSPPPMDFDEWCKFTGMDPRVGWPIWNNLDLWCEWSPTLRYATRKDCPGLCCFKWSIRDQANELRKKDEEAADEVHKEAIKGAFKRRRELQDRDERVAYAADNDEVNRSIGRLRKLHKL